MLMVAHTRDSRRYARIVAWCMAVCFLSISMGVEYACAALELPAPTQMLSLSRPHSLPALKGVRFDPKHPLDVEFIIDSADTGEVSKEEAGKLVRYFLAGLTIPEKDLWVNLSPYESDRIITDAAARTDLGRDMLSQDYILKQLAASITHPHTAIGKNYWKNVYESAARVFGARTVPLNTFNKIWISADKAEVYEYGSMAVIHTATLKACLEEDVTSFEKTNHKEKALPYIQGMGATRAQRRHINKVASDAMREIVVPKITEDINYGENFALLRQMYSALILAKWFKERFKDSLYIHYFNQKNVKGIDIKDPQAKEKIYELYIQAFKKGLYDYTQKETDAVSQKNVRRRYFSGGIAPLTESVRFVPHASPAIFDTGVTNALTVMKIRLGSQALRVFAGTRSVSQNIRAVFTSVSAQIQQRQSIPGAGTQWLRNSNASMASPWMASMTPQTIAAARSGSPIMEMMLVQLLLAAMPMKYQALLGAQESSGTGIAKMAAQLPRPFFDVVDSALTYDYYDIGYHNDSTLIKKGYKPVFSPSKLYMFSSDIKSIRNHQGMRFKVDITQSPKIVIFFKTHCLGPGARLPYWIDITGYLEEDGKLLRKIMYVDTLRGAPPVAGDQKATAVEYTLPTDTLKNNIRYAQFGSRLVWEIFLYTSARNLISRENPIEAHVLLRDPPHGDSTSFMNDVENLAGAVVYIPDGASVQNPRSGASQMGSQAMSQKIILSTAGGLKMDSKLFPAGSRVDIFNAAGKRMHRNVLVQSGGKTFGVQLSPGVYVVQPAASPLVEAPERTKPAMATRDTDSISGEYGGITFSNIQVASSPQSGNKAWADVSPDFFDTLTFQIVSMNRVYSLATYAGAT